MVVDQLNCFCEDSYVGMTSRKFCKRIKEHIPKSIDEFCKISNKENKFIRVVHASKLSAIAEHLILKYFKVYFLNYSVLDFLKKAFAEYFILS